MHETRLEQMEREHRNLGVLLVRAGEGTVLRSHRRRRTAVLGGRGEELAQEGGDGAGGVFEAVVADARQLGCC